MALGGGIIPAWVYMCTCQRPIRLKTEDLIKVGGVLDPKCPIHGEK